MRVFFTESLCKEPNKNEIKRLLILQKKIKNTFKANSSKSNLYMVTPLEANNIQRVVKLQTLPPDNTIIELGAIVKLLTQKLLFSNFKFSSFKHYDNA